MFRGGPSTQCYLQKMRVASIVAISISGEGGGRTDRVTDLKKLSQVFVTETKLALQ